MKKFLLLLWCLIEIMSTSTLGAAFHVYINKTALPVFIEAQFKGCNTHKVHLAPFARIEKTTGLCLSKKFYFIITLPDGSKRRYVFSDESYGETLPNGNWWFTIAEDNGRYFIGYENEEKILANSSYEQLRAKRYLDEYMAPGATSYVIRPQ